MINKRLEGDVGEKLALTFLNDQGIELLEKNFRTKQGEIDLIYKDGEYVSFAEVKYRASNKYGNPYEAVDYVKRKKICMASRVFLYRKRFPDSTPVRYDVISILGNEITWYKNAFDYLN